MREILLCTLAVLVAAAGIIAMNNHPTIEGFSQTQYCGNVLVQKGDKIVLKNTSKTEVELAAFLAKPKAYLKGTKMSFAGLRKEADQTAVIEYLKTFE